MLKFCTLFYTFFFVKENFLFSQAADARIIIPQGIALIGFTVDGIDFEVLYTAEYLHNYEKLTAKKKYELTQEISYSIFSYTTGSFF